MLRLKHGGAYESDIRALRSSIRRNGTKPLCVDLPISDSDGSKLVSLVVNMAYQPNASCEKADASLYTVAFRNATGRMFRFNLDAPVTIPTAPTDVVQLRENGSYASLGYSHGPFPAIGKLNLQGAAGTVGRHSAERLDKSVKEALVRLIIAVNEAARFEEVEKGISGVLARAKDSYLPPWDVIHDWGGSTLPG